MKTSPFLIALLCVALCSCERSAQTGTGGAGDGSKLTSTDETRRIAMHVLLNRYPQAEIVSESSGELTSRYRFSTNGVVLPVVVVVDRKAGKARFENVAR